jgi:hypothetical protein
LTAYNLEYKKESKKRKLVAQRDLRRFGAVLVTQEPWK